MTAARGEMALRSSRASRDLPMPATPVSVTIAGVRVAMTSTNASRSAPSSAARPTSELRAPPRRTGLRATSRQAATRSDLPFRRIGSTRSRRALPRSSRSVIGPMRISPGPAADSRRWATLTGSPSVNGSPSGVVLTAISPVFTPVWVTSRTSHDAARSPLRSSSAVRISSAARAARTTSSSCRTGTPNTAMTASPMNFSTVPPWRSMTPRISAKYRVITSWRASGSRRSPSAVKPLTSANTTVTVLRACRSPTAGVASDDPQAKQNLAPSMAASPHLGHAAMDASFA